MNRTIILVAAVSLSLSTLTACSGEENGNNENGGGTTSNTGGAANGTGGGTTSNTGGVANGTGGAANGTGGTTNKTVLSSSVTGGASSHVSTTGLHQGGASSLGGNGGLGGVATSTGGSSSTTTVPIDMSKLPAASEFATICAAYGKYEIDVATDCPTGFETSLTTLFSFACSAYDSSLSNDCKRLAAGTYQCSMDNHQTFQCLTGGEIPVGATPAACKSIEDAFSNCQ
jgi:hypothetical protein